MNNEVLIYGFEERLRNMFLRVRVRDIGTHQEDIYPVCDYCDFKDMVVKVYG
jgi:hypothetical protein